VRYGLQFADGNPFPQDIHFGIQLEDETIVVPEECPECPECPPSTCEVACVGIDVYEIKPTHFQCNRRFSDPGYNWPTGGVLVLVPVGEWCGHQTRWLIDEGTLSGHTILPALAVDRDVSIAIQMGTSGSGTFQFQIDLTDAAPGEETWTNMCSLVSVSTETEG
jgi:hypothetical protein